MCVSAHNENTQQAIKQNFVNFMVSFLCYSSSGFWFLLLVIHRYSHAVDRGKHWTNVITIAATEMACATLKRSSDWESINQRPSKRRRCMPFGSARHNQQANKRRLYYRDELSPRASDSIMVIRPDPQLGFGFHQPQQLLDTLHSNNQSQQQPHGRQKFQPDLQQFDPVLSTEPRVNAFPKMTPEKMAKSVHDELLRMAASRRKQLQFEVCN